MDGVGSWSSFLQDIIHANLRALQEQLRPRHFQTMPVSPRRPSRSRTRRTGQTAKHEHTPTHLSWSEWRLGYPLSPFPAAQGERITLVLDLDETLIHSVLKLPHRMPPPQFDFVLQVQIPPNDSCVYHVIKRPHVDYFLSMVSRWFEVVVFTASLEQYANPLIDCLDPCGYIHHRRFRDSCEMVVSRAAGLSKPITYFVKHLESVRSDLGKILIIDNSPLAYEHNKENALPIKAFTMTDLDTRAECVDMQDEELLNMLPFLHSLTALSDVRSVLGLRTAFFTDSQRQSPEPN